MRLARSRNCGCGLAHSPAAFVTLVMQAAEFKRISSLSTRSVDKSVHGVIRALPAREKTRVGFALVKKVPTAKT
jgi:hypothetical protein